MSGMEEEVYILLSALIELLHQLHITSIPGGKEKSRTRGIRVESATTTATSTTTAAAAAAAAAATTTTTTTHSPPEVVDKTRECRSPGRVSWLIARGERSRV